MDWFINILASGLAFFLAGMLLPGVEVKDIKQGFVLVLILAVLDMTVGRALRIVTLGVLSLSVFNWLMNAVLLMVADWFLPGFRVSNFWWALCLAAFVGLSSSFAQSIL